MRLQGYFGLTGTDKKKKRIRGDNRYTRKCDDCRKRYFGYMRIVLRRPVMSKFRYVCKSCSHEYRQNFLYGVYYGLANSRLEIINAKNQSAKQAFR